jgi:hypothetical protein
VDRLRAAWTKYTTYRTALAELWDLPTRVLRDLIFVTHPMVGMTNSASARMPVGQRVVMVFSRV